VRELARIKRDRDDREAMVKERGDWEAAQHDRGGNKGMAEEKP
jgi:hypothetical protein